MTFRLEDLLSPITVHFTSDRWKTSIWDDMGFQYKHSGLKTEFVIVLLVVLVLNVLSLVGRLEPASCYHGAGNDVMK